MLDWRLMTTSELRLNEFETTWDRTSLHSISNSCDNARMDLWL